MSAAAPTPPQGPPQQAPRPSGSHAPTRVMSATRAQPLAPEPRAPLKQRLLTGSQDLVLNTAAILREVVEDFRNRDRYFKFKALILATWALLSTTSLGVACAGTDTGASSDLQARLVLAGDAHLPVYTLFNDSAEAWTDVTVIINKRYRAASAQVRPGGNLTLTPRQLVGEDGQPAPGNLQARDVEVRTADGRDVLMSDGELE